MRDRYRRAAEIEAVHQKTRDDAVANARPVRPFRARDRGDDCHQYDHQGHADCEIGEGLGIVQHIFGADKAGAPEHDENRRRRARSKILEIMTHLQP